MTSEVASQLATFNNTKLFIHAQRDEFFRKGVSVKATTTAGDETKSENGRTTTRVIDTCVNDVNPLELDADIAHFKEHFSNMKWMYLEQETKEAYLRAILGDPPEVIEQKDNDELETKNAAAKAKLKAKKREMENLCAQVSSLVKEVSDDYTDLTNKSNETNLLLTEIRAMQSAITDLKNAQEQANTDQNLPLPASISLLSSRKSARDQLAIELERKTQENTKKRREVEKLRAQLQEMDRNRVDAEMFAREAEKMKNAENLQEELASKKKVGWWLKAMTATQMEFLGLREFKFDEKAEEVRLVLKMENIGDIPVLLQLKDHKLENAKIVYKGQVRVEDIVAETKKRGGDLPFFLEQLKMEIIANTRR